jgi:tetratricopeptide (TPR) repeat protein
MSKNGTTDAKAHAEQLMREAVALFEQGRLEEALLACEGALALDETYAPALSLKGLIHERRGQVAEAMAAYERVQAVNPLSVAERARLDALRRQARAVVRPAPVRPLWAETLPVALAFLGVGLVLLIGFALILALECAACARAEPARGVFDGRAFAPCQPAAQRDNPRAARRDAHAQPAAGDCAARDD